MVPRTRLIGRERELDEIDYRLRSHRLVTVVGPGGVGKTSTAREAARVAAERFPLGVRFVDLARVDDSEAVAGTFAAQLGFASVEALLNSPADQPALVVADNCEHVLDAAARAIDALLEACEQPTVLTTSRSPLDVPGESVVAVAPLPVPLPGDPATMDSPAIQLFLARARDAGAVIPPGELDTVVLLCRRLDGLPLAIEIAAARTRTMSPKELLARLDAGGVHVLDRPRFRGTSRHRGVADLIRWSTDLLQPEEVGLLEDLALLHGSFTLDEVRRTFCAADCDLDATTEALAHASLLSVDTTAQVTRYRLFDVVRSCALERLRDRGVLAEKYDRFVDQVIATVRERLAARAVQRDPRLLRDVAGQFDDIAEALRWCIGHDTNPQRALSLCAALLVIVQQGRAHEIGALVDRVCERWPEVLAEQPPGAAAAIGTLAIAEILTGRADLALELAETGLRVTDEPSWAVVTMRQTIAESQVALGDRSNAAAAFAAAAAEARELGLTAMALESELAIAQLAADRGEEAAALAAMAAARDEADATGSTATSVWASTLMAWTTLRRDPLSALTLARVALDAARDIEFPNGSAGNLRTMAFAHLRAGDVRSAAESVDALLREVREGGSLSNARMLVDVAAVLAHEAGHASRGPLASTVGGLAPATLLSSPGYDLVALPATAHPALPVRDALLMVAHLVDDVRAGTAATGSAGAPPQEPPAMRWRGDVWELTYAGHTVAVRASKGLSDLAALLASSGREVHCLELVGAATYEQSTGEVIDAESRRRYEHRIRDLQADIDHAEVANDYVRAERARAELDAIVEHLAAALGRGGRARRSGGTVERARSTVTQRLRAALRHLEGVHPELGRHLQRSVRTGTYCSYAPERPTTWTVELRRP